MHSRKRATRGRLARTLPMPPRLNTTSILRSEVPPSCSDSRIGVRSHSPSRIRRQLPDTARMLPFMRIRSAGVRCRVTKNFRNIHEFALKESWCIVRLRRATPAAILHPSAYGLQKINDPQSPDVVERDVGEMERTSVHRVIVHAGSPTIPRRSAHWRRHLPAARAAASPVESFIVGNCKGWQKELCRSARMKRDPCQRLKGG